jgi:hypothetical protein
MGERIRQSQEKSDWKPRLLKVGVASTFVGAVVGSTLFLGIGLSALGGSWYLGKKEKK